MEGPKPAALEPADLMRLREMQDATRRAKVAFAVAQARAAEIALAGDDLLAELGRTYGLAEPGRQIQTDGTIVA